MNKDYFKKLIIVDFDDTLRLRGDVKGHNMGYHKTLVVDIDDTISFTINRDWENAKPNFALIDKLNKLFDIGWEVHYYTARGWLSFNGDRKKADDHYRPIIEKWFSENNVKYTSLSFEKHLAAYYIDDKAIRPDEFINLQIQELKGGLSGAYIERRGDLVYKTHRNSLESAGWFKEASNIIKTPKVHSLIGDTICLDYIEKKAEPEIRQIVDIIEEFRKVPAYQPFSTYIKRLDDHMSLYSPSYQSDVIELLKDNSFKYDNEKTFCHGDMSFDNMINDGYTLYLIDPNRPNDLYSSWLLDVSKLLHTSRRFNVKNIYPYFIKRYNEYESLLRLLELTHWIRMRKYEKPENINKLDNIIAEILREIDAE